MEAALELEKTVNQSLLLAQQGGRQGRRPPLRLPGGQLPQRAGGRDQGDRGHDHQDQAGRRRSRSPHHRQRDAGLALHLGGHLALLSAKTDCTATILKLCLRTLSSFLCESKAYISYVIS